VGLAYGLLILVVQRRAFGSVGKISLDASGERLIVGYSNGTVCTWRMYNGKKLQGFAGIDADRVSAVVDAAEFGLLAASVASGRIVFWNDRTQRHSRAAFD